MAKIETTKPNTVNTSSESLAPTPAASRISPESEESPLSASNRLKNAWSVVEKSRHPQRPHSIDYLHKIFSEFEELKGDRVFGEDSALIAGVGLLRTKDKKKEPLKVFFLAHEKGRNTKQKIERNFGMARPEGYRKAMRIMEMAERFQKPLLTLIDTPGAFPGIGAEERGQSEAIASSILRLLKVRVPTLGIVIGEGGSGGALAIGATDRLLMLENSIYSVISPESCAAILWGSASESKQAAAALKMSAQETYDIGICDEVIPEKEEGAHAHLETTAQSLLERIDFHLRDLLSLSAAERESQRYEKFRHIDARHLGSSEQRQS